MSQLRLGINPNGTRQIRVEEPREAHLRGVRGTPLNGVITVTASAQAVRRREERLRDVGRKRHGRVG